jgi:peptide/nickel transport system substrate-binding protein
VLQDGEIDWQGTPTTDYPASLRRRSNLDLRISDPSGSMPMLRMNWLPPPFDKPAIRRLVLQVIKQADFMQALAGTDLSLYKTGAGVFPQAAPSPRMSVWLTIAGNLM